MSLSEQIDSHHIDSVKFQNAKTIMTYRRLQHIAKMSRALQVFVLLALLSWSSTRLPTAFRLSGEYILNFSVHLLNSRIVFLIGNAIVLGLYLLSRQNNNAGDSYGNNTGSYDEITPSSDDRLRSAAVACDDEMPVPMPTPPLQQREETAQIDRTVDADTETKIDEAAAVIEWAKKEIRRFERTQSEKLKRELRVKSHHELRRSETESQRRNLTSGKEGEEVKPVQTVESLNSEEFRRTIETFIQQHKKVGR